VRRKDLHGHQGTCAEIQGSTHDITSFRHRHRRSPARLRAGSPVSARTSPEYQATTWDAWSGTSIGQRRQLPVGVLTTKDGVVLFDAPPSIGGNIRRAVDEIASANGVSNKVTHLVYSHHHADHAGASSLFDKNVIRSDTRRPSVCCCG